MRYAAVTSLVLLVRLKPVATVSRIRLKGWRLTALSVRLLIEDMADNQQFCFGDTVGVVYSAGIMLYKTRCGTVVFYMISDGRLRVVWILRWVAFL